MSNGIESHRCYLPLNIFCLETRHHGNFNYFCGFSILANLRNFAMAVL